jgi:hypothetical protein
MGMAWNVSNSRVFRLSQPAESRTWIKEYFSRPKSFIEGYVDCMYQIAVNVIMRPNLTILNYTENIQLMAM